MYTVFQPFLIHLFYSFIYLCHLFCPVQHQNRDRDCTFGLVSNMSTHHEQKRGFRINTSSFCWRPVTLLQWRRSQTASAQSQDTLGLEHSGEWDGEQILARGLFCSGWMKAPLIMTDQWEIKSSHLRFAQPQQTCCCIKYLTILHKPLCCSIPIYISSEIFKFMYSFLFQNIEIVVSVLFVKLKWQDDKRIDSTG